MSDIYAPPLTYKSLLTSDNEPGQYSITHTKWWDPPVANCKYIKSMPCPADKTSYWRGFATDLKRGGCGEPKKLCGASALPKVGPPHYVVEPAAKTDLINFL